MMYNLLDMTGKCFDINIYLFYTFSKYYEIQILIKLSFLKIVCEVCRNIPSCYSTMTEIQKQFGEPFSLITYLIMKMGSKNNL